MIPQPKAPRGCYWRGDTLWGSVRIGVRRIRWSLHTSDPAGARARRAKMKERLISDARYGGDVRLPRHVIRKPIKDGLWSYFFKMPPWARAAGCPVKSEALGSNYAAVLARVEVLLPAFDEWRTGHKEAPRRTKPRGRKQLYVLRANGSTRFARLPQPPMPKRASAAPSVAEGFRPEVNTMRGGRACTSQQIGDAARDRRRGIDEGYRPGRKPFEALEQQRIVRAGEHDRVGAASAGIDEAGRNLARDQIVRNRRAIELVLREAREPRGAGPARHRCRWRSRE
jgi:hypothetical protein